MKGTVISVNQRKGFVAARTDHGITVIELLGGYEVEVGDVLTGDLDTHGGEKLRNETKSETMDVYIQAIHCSPASAQDLMR